MPPARQITRLGFGRTIPAAQLPAPAALPSRRTATGRHLLALHISAPGARGLRLGLRVQGLPNAAALRFAGPGAATPRTLAGALVNASLAADAAAGSTEPRFWSPLVDGAAMTLRIPLPARTNPQRVHLGLPLVSHLTRLPGEAPPTRPTDPACHPAWERQNRSTTLLLYETSALSRFSPAWRRRP